MIAVGQAFGPWVTAASFVYGLYSDWQRRKQDKETAKKIIREAVAAGGSIAPLFFNKLTLEQWME